MSNLDVKRTYELDSADLVLNYECFECPHCDGGEIRYFLPDSFEQVVETCDECGGSGELALYNSGENNYE